MKKVCEDHIRNFYSAGAPPDRLRLANAAQTFAILQDQRHIADYDKGAHWSKADAMAQIDLAAAAFADWRNPEY